MSGLQVLCIDLGTELAPAVSFANEKPEADVMSVPPRNHKTDRLVNSSVVIYIFVCGLIESAVAIIPFLLYFTTRGIGVAELNFTGVNYWSIGSNPITFNNGLTLIDVQQVEYLAEASTIYWITTVMQQFMHIWFVKTRRVPLWQHGMFNNITMIFGVILEVSLMLTIAYAPPFQSFFGTASFTPTSLWAFFLLGGFCLFLVNEPRKVYVKANPDSFVAKYLSW